MNSGGRKQMKRKIVGIFVCMLMIGGATLSATATLNIKTGSFCVGDGVVNVIIPIESYKIEKTTEGDILSAKDFGRLLVPGKPNLPSKIFSVAIPPGAKLVGISFDTKDVVLFGSYKILPSPLPRVVGEENPLLYEQELNRYNENYKSVYDSSNPYPASAVELVGMGGYRKYNLVDVRVNPFAYYPSSDKLIYHSAISLSIKYTIPEGFSSQDIMSDNLPQTEKIAKEIILNYDQAKNWYSSGLLGRDSYDYIIITTDSLTSSVTTLANWERNKGRSVNVVTTSWISNNYQGYDLAAKIRAFLLEKYPSSEWGIQDVCLVGSYNDVPMRLCWQDVGYGKPKTDYYYAELSLPDNQSWDSDGDHRYGENSDPIDFEAEINVGRIPWGDSAIVQSICEKSVAYEQNNNPSFKKNILLLGAFFWDNDPNPRTDNAVLMEYKTNPSNNPWMSDWTRTRMYEQGYSTYSMDYDLTYTNVRNIWSTGTYAFVDWAGHGSPTACVRYHPSETEFVDTDTCPYLNDNYPAIIFADACSNADTDYLNLGQSMLQHGGVGFVGSNKVALGCPGWSNPLSGSSQSMDYYFTSCCTSGDYTQGAALQWSLRQMYTNNLWDYVRYEMFEWGSLFGNPDLSMGSTSNPPDTPSITGPTQGAKNIEYTFSSVTTDPDGDQVYYRFDWGDGNASDWLGPYASGLTITATHSWSDLGTYDIKVRAKDTYGALSNWSEPLPISIILNDPPNTPQRPTGSASGKIHVQYTYNATTTDPDNDQVYYKWSWGDGNISDWLGPFTSGEIASAQHTWNTKGSYEIKVKAKDIQGFESNWSEPLLIKMPKNDLFSFHLYVLQCLEQLFERFPHAFLILRYLVSY
jgi:hypothetical protein